jgi:hypothetical protein
VKPLAELFAWRNGSQATLAVYLRGRGFTGVNLHRTGGVSITGIPGSGGTTVAWGRLRARGDHMDREGSTQRRRFACGPVAVRIGRDF